MQLDFRLSTMIYDPKSQTAPNVKRDVALRNLDHLHRLQRSSLKCDPRAMAPVAVRCCCRLSCRGVGILLIVLTTLAIGIHVAKMEFSYQFGQIRNKKLELPPSGPMPKP